MTRTQLRTTLVVIALGGGVGAWAFTSSATPVAPRTATLRANVGQPMVAADDEKEDDEKGQEMVIALEKAPDAVQAAALKLAGSAKSITKVIRETDEGITAYEIEYTEGGTASSAILSPAGDLVELEKTVAQDRIPAAALAALKKEHPRAAIAEAAMVTKTFYEVVVTIDGKKHEVKVDAAGNIEDEHGEEAGHGHADAKRGGEREEEENDDD